MTSSAEPPAPSPWRELRVPALVVGTLLLFIFAPALPRLVEIWFEDGGYYQHAPLVPLVCAWLVWRDRERLRRIPLGASPLGLLVVLVALWIFVVGLLENSATLQRYAVFFAVFGGALVLVGTSLVRATWFAWAFAIVFMFPFSPTVLNNLTLELKLAAAQLTYAAVDTLGIAAVRQGDTIHFVGGRTVLVDDVCSGLRSLVTLLAVASLFAHLQAARWKRWLIVALAVPIAVFANSVRVLILCLLAARGTPADAGGFLHEATGVAIYLIALLLLYGVQSLPEREERIPPAIPDEPLVAAPTIPRRWLHLLVVELILGFAISVPFWTERAGLEQRETHVTQGVPLVIGDWRGHDLKLPGAQVEILNNADFFFRRYTRGSDAGQVDLFVFHSNTLAGVHPPPGCYTLQGFVEQERGATTLQTPRGELTVTRALIAQAGRRELVYYWYRLNGEHVAGYWTMRLERVTQRLTFRGESRDGSTIRLSTRLNGDLQAAEERLRAFAAESLGTVLDPLP